MGVEIGQLVEQLLVVVQAGLTVQQVVSILNSHQAARQGQASDQLVSATKYKNSSEQHPKRFHKT